VAAAARRLARHAGSERVTVIGLGLSGLLALQAACLILYIPGRLGTIVRADVTSKMIESHRLMPIPPTHAIAGYIMGAATQPLVFCGGIFFFGAMIAAAAGVSPARWAFASAVLLAFAAFVWAVFVYAAFGGKIGTVVLGAFIGIPYLTQGYILTLVPGMTVLLSPIIGQSVFDLRGGTSATLPATYAISFAAQAFFAVVCFVAAARAYRSSIEVSLDTVLGVCLLLGWTGVSIAGLREWENFRPRGWRTESVETPIRVLASMIIGLLAALVPVASNAYERMLWRRRIANDDPYPRRRPLGIAFVIAIAVAIILAIAFAPPDMSVPEPQLLLRTTAILTVTLVALYFVFATTYRFTRTAVGAATGWIFVSWILPIGADLTRHALGELQVNQYLATTATCSPIGALIVLWGGPGGRAEVSTTIGIGVQILIALVPKLLWISTYDRRRIGSRLETPAASPASS
jgi:hypothetical protein